MSFVASHHFLICEVGLQNAPVTILAKFSDIFSYKIWSIKDRKLTEEFPLLIHQWTEPDAATSWCQ